MCVRPEGTAIILLELEVMNRTKNRLEEEQAKDQDTNHWVIMVDELCWDLVDEPYADTESADVEGIGEELEESVDPP